jgi:hypothetical protein
MTYVEELISISGRGKRYDTHLIVSAWLCINYVWPNVDVVYVVTLQPSAR